MAEFTHDDRVELVSTTDLHTKLKPGDTGTVAIVDDLGTVHIKWDNGSALGMSTQHGDVIRLLPTATPAIEDAPAPRRINTSSPEGAAILELVTRIRKLEDEGGCSWNGGDLVVLLGKWFRTVGIDEDASAETVRERLCRGPHVFTVFALRDNLRADITLVAGVVRGDFPCFESEFETTFEGRRYQRVCCSVLASDPDEAEALALQLFEADRTGL